MHHARDLGAHLMKDAKSASRATWCAALMTLVLAILTGAGVASAQGGESSARRTVCAPGEQHVSWDGRDGAGQLATAASAVTAARRASR